MLASPASTWLRRNALRSALAIGALAGCSPSAQVNAPQPVAQVDLHISVHDSLDAPLAGVTIAVDHLEEHAVLGVSDAQGRFTARVPATLLHSVYAAKETLAVATEIEVRVEDIPAGLAVDLTLRRAVVVRGIARLAGRTDHSGIQVLTQGLPVTTTTNAAGDWLLDGWPSEYFGSAILVRPGFGVGLQWFGTGAPGDTTTLPAITLVSDPGGS